MKIFNVVWISANLILKSILCTKILGTVKFFLKSKKFLKSKIHCTTKGSPNPGLGSKRTSVVMQYLTCEEKWKFMSCGVKTLKYAKSFILSLEKRKVSNVLTTQFCIKTFVKRYKNSLILKVFTYLPSIYFSWCLW